MSRNLILTLTVKYISKILVLIFSEELLVGHIYEHFIERGFFKQGETMRLVLWTDSEIYEAPFLQESVYT